MDKYCLVIDVWEGNLDIDEAALVAGKVDGIIVRLNAISGQIHMDENFTAQWEQAKPFVRWVYFVYSPWYSAELNYQWLADHIPSDAKRVMIDVEVRKDGYPPSRYASELMRFIGLAKQRWLVDIYTGGGCLDMLSSWPTDIQYTWARYPDRSLPLRSWAQVHNYIRGLSWNPGKLVPGPCKLWQVSGDQVKPEGCNNRTVDICVFDGSLDELKIYAGYRPEVPVDDGVDWAKAITEWARKQPNPYTGPDPKDGITF